MKLFIDTAVVDEIREINALGILAGVTTNPSLVAKSGKNFVEVLKEILSIVEGPVSAEVLSRESQGMIDEGERLAALSKQITIKIPMTLEGLKAVHYFSKKGFQTNVTLIFSVNQALMAARAGATFISPFVGRLDDINQDGIRLIKEIADVFYNYDIHTQIIAASIRSSLHVTQAAFSGAHISTIPYTVIKQMILHPLTDQGIEKFEADWKKVNKDIRF